jgi:predicted nuclease of predicted toxin-antitoxin system
VNILADESVEYEVIERLRADGHSVLAITDLSQGMPDPAVLALAAQRHLLLLTADRDFGDMIRRDLHQAPRERIVLYRLRHISTTQKALTVADAFARHGPQLPNAFTVIAGSRIRHRPLP